MGELQHGIYDDCEDLTGEEVNVFYNFYENGELHSDNEDSDQSDQSENEEDFLHEGCSEGHSSNSMDINEFEHVGESDHGFSTEVRCS